MPRSLVMSKVSTAHEIEQLRVFCLKHSALEQEILATTGIESFVFLGRDEKEWSELTGSYGDFLFSHPACGYFLFFENSDLDNAIGLIECEPELHNGLLSMDKGFLPAAQGQGYGTQATKLFLTYITPFIGQEIPIMDYDGIIANHTLDGILSGIEINNLPSLIVNIRAGFTMSNYEQYLCEDIKHAVYLTFPPNLDQHVMRAQHHFYFEIYNPAKAVMMKEITNLAKALQTAEYSSREFAANWSESLYPILETQKSGDYGMTFLEKWSLQAQFNDLCFSVIPHSDELVIFGACEPLALEDGAI